MSIDILHVLHKWQALLTTPKAILDYIVVGGLLLFTFGLDFALRRNWRRYFSRHFLTDFTYYVVYYGGFYAFLYSPIGKALNASLDRHMPFLRLDLLRHMPVSMQIVTFIVVSDFLSYWQHRWMHVFRPLWSIHKIHHSQEQLTIFTNFRFHLFEETFRRLMSFIPFVMMGAAPVLWIWADVLGNFVLLMQHSGTHWRYSWLDRVFVSPRYHEIHHSADVEMRDHNYSALFSFWDRMFGTRDEVHDFADRYGIEPRIAEGFWAQLLVPIREWLVHLRLRRPSPSVPEAPQQAA